MQWLVKAYCGDAPDKDSVLSERGKQQVKALCESLVEQFGPDAEPLILCVDQEPVRETAKYIGNAFNVSYKEEKVFGSGKNGNAIAKRVLELQDLSEIIIVVLFFQQLGVLSSALSVLETGAPVLKDAAESNNSGQAEVINCKNGEVTEIQP